MACHGLQFSAFKIDLDRPCLIGAFGPVRLRPKCLELLHYLLQHPGRVVCKGEAIEAVWPGVIATDESLTRCVSEIRLALGDEGRRIIKTVAGVDTYSTSLDSL